MYSSPATPTGAGDRARSSTWRVVLARGPPMGMVHASSSTSRTGCQVAKVVLSVGPYTCSSRSGPPASRTARTLDGSTASPPNIRWRRVPKPSGISRATWLKRAVVRNEAVTPCRRNAATSVSGRSVVSRSRHTSAAPFSRAPQISKVNASNEVLETCATRSSPRTCT